MSLLVSPGKARLTAGYLRDGLSISDGVERRFVLVEESEDEDLLDEEEEEDVEEEWNPEAEVGSDAEQPKDEVMDVDGRNELLTPPPSPPPRRVSYRPRSPDMSWLPPLPTADVQVVDAGTGAADVPDTTPAPQSIADRYRRPVAYRNSQLAETREFDEPPKPATSPEVPPAPSSFSSLVKTYEATLTEPSVALRQTDGRRQAADLLRLTVGNPDKFSTKDTLFQALPPPHVSPIVPSHSDVLPTRLLPVNPNQGGVISSLVHQIRTPFLPPTLRERLTSLRPPQAQMNDNKPVLFGEPIRGADDAALAKARGKATGEEVQAFFRATWDSGPHGSEKWTRGRLPSGRKVVKAVEGAVAPRAAREPDAAKALRLKIADRVPGLMEPATPAFSPSTTLKLRLGATKPSAFSTPTADRVRPTIVTSESDTPVPRAFHSSIGANDLADSPSVYRSRSNGSSSPKKRSRLSGSPVKRSMSPIKQEPMQLD